MPDKQNRIFLASPHMSDAGYEKGYVAEAFESNWVAPLGPNVDGFEREFADCLGVPDAAALSSGTAALHLALIAAGVGKGDTVLCASFTFAASANPIIYQGATPVFVDSERETWNMSPEALEHAFEKHPNAKAVIAVNLYGMTAKMKEIGAICKRHGAVLIEDAAESLGSVYRGQMSGTFGDFSIFSFNGNKIITTSGGGMLVSNAGEETAKQQMQKVRFWATQSRDPAPHYQHTELGFNYRMSNITAGIGRGQLNVLDERVRQKQAIYAYYKTAFSGIDAIEMMPVPEGQQPNCWLSCITLKQSASVTPAMIMKALAAEDIESRPLWKPMHLQPFYADCDYFNNGGVAEDLFRRGLCLPSDTKLDGEDLKRITEIIKSLWRGTI